MQTQVPGSGSDSRGYQLYYGNASAASPPADVNGVRLSNVERTDFPYAWITQAPSVAAGSAISPPSSGSPDLVLHSLSTYPVDGETFEGGMIVQAIGHRRKPGRCIHG